MNWEENIINLLEKHIAEDQDDKPMYDANFFKSLEKYRPIYHFLADIITTHLKPRSVIDWGCGCGYLLEKLLMNGITDIHGIEGSKEVVPFIPESLIPFINIADVLLCDSAGYDLAISIEVGEHLKEKDSAKFVNNICNSADKYIWWSAAQIGQNGTGHINCRPLSWWEKVFEEVGLFEPDWELTYQIKQEMLKNNLLVLGYNWLHSNLIIWRKI